MKTLSVTLLSALLLCFYILTPVFGAEPLETGNYYFKATWCGSCQSQSKIVATLEEQGYTFTIYDADAHPDIFKDLDIKAIPMIIIVKSKDVILKLKGKQPIRKLIKVLVKDQESD